jgi:hypothetical protein
MVKSSSRPRKTSKFVIDLGPEIDKVVKKKNAKIKKQKRIIKALENDPKIKKHKVIINSLQKQLSDTEKRVINLEDELKRYKVGRVSITNKTVENAFKNLRNGQSLFRMKTQTKRLIEMSGRWEEARKIHTQKMLC